MSWIQKNLTGCLTLAFFLAPPAMTQDWPQWRASWTLPLRGSRLSDPPSESVAVVPCREEWPSSRLSSNLRAIQLIRALSPVPEAAPREWVTTSDELRFFRRFRDAVAVITSSSRSGFHWYWARPRS